MLSRTLDTAGLRRLFLNLARGAAASSTLAACSAEHGVGGRNEKWAAVSCADSLASVGALDSAAGVDQLAVYWVNWLEGGAPLPELEGQQFPVRRAATGELCSKADAIADCRERVEALEQQRCAQTPCTFALTRQGDKLVRIDERAALLDLLGDVNTAAEAVLLAAFDQHVICLGPSFAQDQYADEIGARVRQTGQGYELESTYQECGNPLYRKRWSISGEGEIAELESEELAPPTCVPGRRPPGLCDRDAPASAQAGVFLAECARMEHASIYAFDQLLRELEAHGAPEALRQRVREALVDEARHTRAMGELARAYGATPRTPEVEPSALRSLFQIAVDNATEGCLRETFSALIATYQAENARDARVRSALAEIAQDETRHAALSWQLMAWLTPQLSDTERAYVREAQRQTAAELVQGDACALTAHERALLGMPERDVCMRMAQGMLDALLPDQVAFA